MIFNIFNNLVPLKLSKDPWETPIVEIKKKHKILKNIDKEDNFYFVHSYKFKTKSTKNSLSITRYNENFSSIINSKNIFGFQFHPEKSQISGLKLLKNFIEEV